MLRIFVIPQCHKLHLWTALKMMTWKTAEITI